MTRVLVAGDTHGNTAHVATLLDVAERQGCDRVVQLGDWGFWEHTAEGRRFLVDVERHAARRGVTVYALDGNHDKMSLVLELHPDRDDEGFYVVSEHLRYVPRGHRWTWDGVRFAAFGGAYSVDKQWRIEQERRTGRPGTLWFPEEEMTDGELDDLLAADRSSVDVMLTHDKPRASDPRWGRKDLPQCWPNQDRIQRAVLALEPSLLLHGHLHHRYSDRIRCGDDRWTVVEGLDADPQAGGRGYSPDGSWTILDLALVPRRHAADV